MSSMHTPLKTQGKSSVHAKPIDYKKYRVNEIIAHHMETTELF